MDIFSILLPDALLTYLLMGEMGAVVPGERYTKLAGAEAWAALLFASYLLGHWSSCSALSWTGYTTGSPTGRSIAISHMLPAEDVC